MRVDDGDTALSEDGEPRQLEPLYQRTRPAPRLKFGGIVRGSGDMLAAARQAQTADAGDTSAGENEEGGGRFGLGGAEASVVWNGDVGRGGAAGAAGEQQRFEWLRYRKLNLRKEVYLKDRCVSKFEGEP